MHNSKSIQCMRILNIPNDCSVNEDHLYLFWPVCELQLASYGLKTVPKMPRGLCHEQVLTAITCMAFLAIIVLAWCIWSGHTWTRPCALRGGTSLLNINSFIVFFMNLSLLEDCLVKQRTLLRVQVYITCGCSVFKGEYDSVIHVPPVFGGEYLWVAIILT